MAISNFGGLSFECYTKKGHERFETDCARLAFFCLAENLIETKHT